MRHLTPPSATRSRALRRLVLIVATLGAASPAVAQQTRFITPTDAAWFNPLNWDNGLPNSNSFAYLPQFPTLASQRLTLDLDGQVAEAAGVDIELGLSNSFTLTNGVLLTQRISPAVPVSFFVDITEIDVGISALDEFSIVQLGAGVFDPGSADFRFSQPIGIQPRPDAEPVGTDNFAVQAGGTFSAANTYTGTTFVISTLRLIDDGSLNSEDNGPYSFFGSPPAGTVARNSRLILDNSNVVRNDRLREDQTLGLKSSEVIIIGHTVDDAAPVLGTVLLESGESTLTLGYRGALLEVTANDLVRLENRHASFVLASDNPDYLPQLRLNTPTFLSEMSGPGNYGTPSTPILPWAVASSEQLTGTTHGLVPATLDSDSLASETFILRPVNSSEVLFNTLTDPGGGSPANVLFLPFNAPEPITTPTTVNSLTLPSGLNVVVDDQLTLAAGLLIINDRNSVPTRLVGTGSLSFGNAHGHLYLNTPFRDPNEAVEIHVPIVAPEGFTKSGTGTLHLFAPSPDLAGTLTINRGDVVPLNDLAFGTADVVLAGSAILPATPEREARLVINQDTTLSNRILNRTFGDYGNFGVLWYAPLVLNNGATLTLNADPAGDSYFSLQSGDSTPVTLILAGTAGTPGEFGFSSINIFDFAEVRLTGSTANQLELYSPTASITGNGETLETLRVQLFGTIAPGTPDNPIGTLSARLFDGFGGNLTLDIGGPNNSDQIRITELNPLFFEELVRLFGIHLTLNLLPDYTPILGHQITLIDLLGNKPVRGTFPGFAEGATFSLGGFDAYLTYTGGDGNDVVLIFSTGLPNFVLGDFNFDGGFDSSDVDPFVLALSDFSTYLADFADAFAAAYPGLTLDLSVVDIIGDFNGDGGFDGSDVDGFIAALSGARPGTAAIPEPAALGLLAPAALLLSRRRRK